MSNVVELLTQYKQEIIALGKSNVEKQFIEDSFTRWYFNSQPDQSFVPKCNLVNKTDLQFANIHKGCRFQVATMISTSKRKYNELIKKVNMLSSDTYENQDNLISPPQLERLHSLYKLKESTYESDKNKLIAIYKFVGMNSAHLSIPPIFSGIELFGSPLNTHNPFCSPFEFEKKFSSLGSFFNFSISKSSESIFTCNPPFDETIMDNMVEHLESELKAANSNKTIIITIPVWDSASQKKLGIRDFGMDFAAYDKLIKSPFLKENDILDRAMYPYWDYYKQRTIPVSYTHLIILSNNQPEYTINNIKEMWQKYANEN
jgi:hypothetical protein